MSSEEQTRQILRALVSALGGAQNTLHGPIVAERKSVPISTVQLAKDDVDCARAHVRDLARAIGIEY